MDNFISRFLIEINYVLTQINYFLNEINSGLNDGKTAQKY